MRLRRDECTVGQLSELEATGVLSGDTLVRSMCARARGVADPWAGTVVRPFIR